MHLLLTDLLTCPRCGPDFGLILLSDELRERRVRGGSVGCANCRTSFPISGGAADLRHPASPPLVPTEPLTVDAERPLRVAALLGVRGANSTVLVIEPVGGVASSIAELLPDVHLVAASPSQPEEVPDSEVESTSRILTGQRLPLRSSTLKGVALLGIEASNLITEVRRVLLPGGHLVVEPAPGWLGGRLREEGFVVHLEQDGVVVAGTPDRG